MIQSHYWNIQKLSSEGRLVYNILFNVLELANQLVLDANNFALGGMIAMLSIKRLSNESKVIKMDIDKLKKLKIAILCARALVILFIPMCMAVMSILAGSEIVNRDLFFPLLIIGCTIFFFGFILVDELDFLIRLGLTKRELMSDLDETDKED